MLALLVAGSGLIVAGLAPENERASVHATGALIGLVSLNVAMIVLGRSIQHATRWLGTVALTAGIVGFAGLGLFLDGVGGVPAGAAERVADFPGAAMVDLFGVYLLASAVKGRSHPGDGID